jgi:hypothetical protein
MSLHTLAGHLQKAGRGQDSVLVHMTPGEVQGLQKLAMAHGGSLTINPETGLPEAGILSAILPMAAGFFLGPAGLGIAKTALGASAIVGGATAVATGSLSKGLMAGFGAYGGFGLAEGLAGAGAAANAAKAGVSTLDDVAAAKAAQLSGTGGIPNKISDALGATNTGASNVLPVANINQPLVKPYASGFQNAENVYRSGLASTQVPQATQVVLQAPNPIAVQTSADAAAKLQQLGGTGGIPNKLSDALGATKAAPVTNWGNVKAGFSDVTSSGTKAWNFVKEHPGPFIGLGVGALQEYQEQQAKDAARAAAAGKKTAYIRPFEMSVAQNQAAYAPNASTAEREFFTQPRFIPGTPYVAKEGGLMASQNYAVGGPVEQMSAQNAVGDNTGYPMAHLQTPMYSNPMVQRPIPTDVIQSGLDAPVDRYTGEQRFAFGGSVASAKATAPSSEAKYAYNPETMQYTQTTTTAPAANTRLTGNPMIDGMLGLFSNVGPYGIAPNMQRAGPGGGNFTGFSKGFGGLGGATINPAFAALYGNQQSAPQPTVNTQTSGGIAAPYAAQIQQAPVVQGSTITPNIQLQPQRTPEQQLGLEGFYDMMDMQLAKKGAQMQGMANGGMAFGGSATASASAPSSEAKYSYDPATMQYTMTSAPSSDFGFGKLYGKNVNPFLGATVGIMSLLTKKPINELLNIPASNGPTVGSTSGGIESPYAAQAQQVPTPQGTTITPNINIPTYQTPEQQLGLEGFYDMMDAQLAKKDAQMQNRGMANGGMAGGGYNLGGYSDGGRLLRGPGDGVSDSIPAVIGRRQPARLADGEFVVPARIVSEIGNGSTEAGARKLYAMMDRVQKARKKSVGKGKVAVNSKSERFLPA